MQLFDAVGYPLRGDEAPKTILIGSLLFVAGLIISLVATVLSIIFIGFLLLPLTFVPLLFVQGYLVRVLRTTTDGAALPPVFDDWEELLFDGLRLFAVVLVYSIPVIVVSVVGSIAVVLGGASLGAVAGDAGAAPGAAFGGAFLLVAVISLLSILLSILIGYFAPISLCMMAREQSIGAAFDFDRLRRVATDTDYAVAWLAAAVVYIGGGFVGNLLSVLLVGFPIVFVSWVIGARMIGLGYASALGIETSSSAGV